MSTFESHSKHVIEQTKFIEVAGSLIQQAQDPETSIEDCMVSAQSVVQGLNDVAAGHLEVQPPLSDEQVSSYRKDSELIISLGQKSMRALEKSERRGILGRKKGDGSSSKPAFSGSGSDAKK